VANGHRCPPVADDVLRAARRAAHEYLALAHQREIDRQQARRRQTRLCERHAG
jgi:hypothetical protein